MSRDTTTAQTTPKISKDTSQRNVLLFGGKGALPVRTVAMAAMSAVSRNGNKSRTTKPKKTPGVPAKFPRGPVRSKYPRPKTTARDTIRKNTGERIGHPYIIHPRLVGTGHPT